MAKSYDEQIADLQKKISDIKAKKARQEKQKIEKLGQAVADRCPEILEKMDEKGFNIFDYVKTKEFANTVYRLYKQDEEKAQAETVQEEIPQAQTQGFYQNIQQ